MLGPNLSPVAALLRTPLWLKPRNSVTTIVLTIQLVGFPDVSVSASVSVLDSTAPSLLAVGVLRALQAKIVLGELITATMVAGSLAACVLALARNYFHVSSTSNVILSIGVGVGDPYLAKVMYYVEGEVDEFAIGAMSFTNTWNAYAAGVAWVAAPWAAVSAPEIVCEHDASLPLLGLHGPR